MPGGLFPFEQGGPHAAFSGGGGASVLTDADTRTLILPGFRWNYLTTTLPTGVADSALKALYQFDGPTLGLTDRSGNGHNLTIEGDADYSWTVSEGAYGCNSLLLFDDTWARSALVATLTSLGVGTMEMVFLPWGFSGHGYTYYVAIGANRETEAANVSFSIRGTDYNGLGYFHESGAGTNRTGVTNWAAGAMGHIQYAALTRAADGITYNFYMDGVFLETLTATAPPTGSTAVGLCVGANFDDSNNVLSSFSSVRWSHAAFTAAQVQEAYYRVRGWID